MGKQFGNSREVKIPSNRKMPVVDPDLGSGSYLPLPVGIRVGRQIFERYNIWNKCYIYLLTAAETHNISANFYNVAL